MRALRWPLAGAIVVSLLAGLSLAVVAQEDEPDAMAPASFTFTRGLGAESIDGDVTDIEGFARTVRGDVEIDIPMQASDPRASGLLTVASNVDQLAFDDSGLATSRSSQRLVNDGGAWSGTGTSLHLVAKGGGFATEMAVLNGEGDYEGLTLITIRYCDDECQTRSGVIVPSHKVPPMPDPVEPSTQ